MYITRAVFKSDNENSSSVYFKNHSEVWSKNAELISDTTYRNLQASFSLRSGGIGVSGSTLSDIIRTASPTTPKT